MDTDNEAEKKPPASVGVAKTPKNMLEDSGKVTDEALDTLETLRHSNFFKQLQSTLRDKMNKNVVSAEEKNHIFQLFQQSKDEEEEALHSKIIEENRDELDIISKTRLPCIRRTLVFGFHCIVFINFVLSLQESYNLAIQETKISAQLLSTQYNCLGIVNTGISLTYFLAIIHGLISVIILFAKTKSSASILIAYACIQLVDAAFELLMLFYRMRLQNINVFTWVESPDIHIAISILVEIFYYLVDVLGALAAIQRFYDLASPVENREKRLRAQSYGKRFLNDQIIYKNAPSFLQRKYVLRKATAFQIYTVLRCVIEESSTRHKKGQKVKFDAAFTKEHIRSAKYDFGRIETLDDDEIYNIIRGRNAERIRDMEADRKKRLEELLAKEEEERQARK